MIIGYGHTVTRPPGTLNRAVADVLRTFAEESFISQTELAKRSGVSQSQVSKIFRAERRMTLDQLEAICFALKVSVVAVIAEATGQGSTDESSSDPADS